jgi:hypothetical protein
MNTAGIIKYGEILTSYETTHQVVGSKRNYKPRTASHDTLQHAITAANLKIMAQNGECHTKVEKVTYQVTDERPPRHIYLSRQLVYQKILDQTTIKVEKWFKTREGRVFGKIHWRADFYEIYVFSDKRWQYDVMLHEKNFDLYRHCRERGLNPDFEDILIDLDFINS